MSYVFGPVPSRRLGRSLGVDLVPFKTCTYDCIYCQLGHTTCKTIERKEYVPLQSVLTELKSRLSSIPDYITLSGSGEPTLFSRVGELIDHIKAMTDIPVAVLTNGSLFWQKRLRAQLLGADLVIPSLDAGDERVFRLVNRPHEDISFEAMLSGLVDFRREFRGQYWLEIFLLEGYTTNRQQLAELAGHVNRIKPDRVQLNTVTRPPADDSAIAVPRERMSELAATFNPPAEIIADFHGVCRRLEFAADHDEILNLLRRRACSLEEIAAGLGMHRNEVLKYVEELAARELLMKLRLGGKLYYKAKQ